ncbi:hypothetical protein RRG08_065466 [Elysia crispata]|uniref:Uncharacterized protein n=1 Tax=Elysia crispata TaxID=231223 RepID=A0AAE0YJ84_9GAST|nr:hypothetical protein RRG08_065466 [Elysia crispata]
MIDHHYTLQHAHHRPRVIFSTSGLPNFDDDHSLPIPLPPWVVSIKANRRSEAHCLVIFLSEAVFGVLSLGKYCTERCSPENGKSRWEMRKRCNSVPV